MSANLRKIFDDVSDETLNVLMVTANWSYTQGSFEQALQIYKGVATMRPESSRGFVGMGISSYGLGRVEFAEAAYRKAIEVDADDQDAHLYLGELVWNERKDADEAIEHLGKAVHIQPRSKLAARARYILSRINEEKNK